MYFVCVRTYTRVSQSHLSIFIINFVKTNALLMKSAFVRLYACVVYVLYVCMCVCVRVCSQLVGFFFENCVVLSFVHSPRVSRGD